MAATDEALTFSRSGSAADASATAVAEEALGEAYDYGVDVDDETRERAQAFTDEYTARLDEWTEAHVHRMAERQMRAGVDLEAGEPTLPGGYQYWNVFTVGPVQFFGNPPYRPGKIIAAGQLAFMLGIIWINPANSPGGGIPATVALGSRDWEAYFETVNLTDVTNGPDFPASGTFAGPAPVVTVVPWFFFAPDPGPRPKIYETHFAVDIRQPGQPFAALSTWHFDIDAEPPFLGVPGVPPQFQHDVPARYLVYRQ